MCRYLKYYSNERQILFSKIKYVESYDCISAPKLDGEIGRSVINKIRLFGKPLVTEFQDDSYIYYHAAPIYWCKAIMNIDILKRKGLNIADSYKKREISQKYKDFAFSLLNSSTFFYYWIVLSDCYNLTRKYISEIRVPIKLANKELHDEAQKLNNDLIRNIQVAEYQYANKGLVQFAQFFPKKSKTIIDEIDKVLAKHYGFTDEELDFIINYDIKYRMGDELGEEEGHEAKQENPIKEKRQQPKREKKTESIPQETALTLYVRHETIERINSGEKTTFKRYLDDEDFAKEVLETENGKIKTSGGNCPYIAKNITSVKLVCDKESIVKKVTNITFRSGINPQGKTAWKIIFQF